MLVERLLASFPPPTKKKQHVGVALEDSGLRASTHVLRDTGGGGGGGMGKGAAARYSDRSSSSSSHTRLFSLD